jgi:hypothetical protein
MDVSNTVAYHDVATIRAVKSFIVQAQDSLCERCSKQNNTSKFNKNLFDLKLHLAVVS